MNLGDVITYFRELQDHMSEMQAQLYGLSTILTYGRETNPDCVWLQPIGMDLYSRFERILPLVYGPFGWEREQPWKAED